MNRVTCPKCGASGDPAQAQPGSAPDTVQCPYCGGDISTLADQAPPLPETWSTAEDGPPPPEPTEYIPWECDGPFLFRLWQTIKLLLFHPVQALSRPARPGYVLPLTFGLLTGIPTMILSTLWNMLIFPIHSDIQIWYVVLSPLLSLIGLYFYSAFLHLFMMLGRANRAGFSATFRAVAYSGAPVIFYIVPILGGMVGVGWQMVIEIGGLSGAHGISIGRAVWAALILPFLVFVGLGVLIVILATSLGS